MATQWGNEEGEATWLESACGDGRKQGSTITPVLARGQVTLLGQPEGHQASTVSL